MNNRDTYVRVRIDAATRDRAAKALEAIGLSIPDAIRLLMQKVAQEQRLPFAVEVPNAETREAIGELEAGRAQRFDSVESLMADLESDA